MIYNSLDVKKLEHNQELYLVRYSRSEYPDFIIVKFKDFEPAEHIRYVTEKGVVKKINMKKVTYRLFKDKNEMARVLYDCFEKRHIELFDDYKPMFLVSQDERPELWI